MMHNIETEKALIGSLLIDEKQFNLVTEHITTPEAFHDQRNKQIFQAMLNIKNKNQVIDLVTVADELPDQMQYIAELTNVTVTSSHAEDYARQIQDKHLRRELYRACQDGAKLAQENGAKDAAAEIDSLFLKATSGLSTNKMMTAAELAEARFRRYIEDCANEKYFYGLPTGFADLDSLIDGLGCGENIILAARPSMGKTALGLNVAINVAKKGKEVDFFSLEMSKERVMDRLLCMEAQVPAKRMRLRQLNDEQMAKLEKAYSVIYNLPIRIHDGRMNTTQIRSALARRAKPGESLAIVDFLTLLTDLPTLSAHERYGSVAKNMQNMAIEFNIPVMTLAQLSRKVEERTNKRPIQSDLRESGNIEEAADKIIFIYRDEYYNPDSRDAGIAEVICEKNRDGETGVVKLTWRPEVLRFGNLAREGI